MSDDMTGRVVVVTGGAGGIGATVTRRWLDAGACVVVVGHSQSSLSRLESDIGRNERLALLATDVTTEDGAVDAIGYADAEFDQPADTLIHLVGGFAVGPIDAQDAVSNWERMMALNLHSAFYCYRAIIPNLRRRGGGWIVGLGSRAAVAPSMHLAAYATSKAGLLALTQAVSDEVKGSNIHVNLILTSTVDTPANREAMGEPLPGAWVTPDDIAEATLFLCSDRARAFYGSTLEVYARA